MMSSSGVVRGLAVVAAVLGGFAAFAGSPYRTSHAAIDVDELARTVRLEEDHVTAVELAQWIKDRRPGLRVIDIRDSDAFADYHVPTAERMSLDSLVVTPFRGDETLVLYSDGGAHAAQGWVFLRALGIRRVFFLRGGLDEWLETIMTPTLPEHPSAAEQKDADAIATLSRYFGGHVTRVFVDAGSAVPLPRTRIDSLPGAKASSGTAAIVARMRRRGC